MQVLNLHHYFLVQVYDALMIYEASRLGTTKSSCLLYGTIANP
jgi:hypothetical protein